MASGESPVEGEEYDVEALRGKRWNEEIREVEYLIKWLHWPERTNTWERAGNLYCPELIEKFEAKQPLPKVINDDGKVIRSKTGFEFGLWPKSITGVSHPLNDPANLFYKVNWEGGRKSDLISTEDLTLRVPCLLLNYLQSLVEMTHDHDCDRKDQIENDFRRTMVEFGHMYQSGESETSIEDSVRDYRSGASSPVPSDATSGSFE